MLGQVELAVLEDAIISACAEHERNYWDRGYRRCLAIQGFFVKFDSHQSLYPEIETLKYVSECAKLDENAPRVPEVLHYFTSDITHMAYAVMDYINSTPTPVPDLDQRVALALQWLRDLPAPPGFVGIGPLGNGYAQHALFKDYEAPLSFSSIHALQRYLDKAIALVQRPCRNLKIPPVSISEERLVFTQSDMDISNFGVDDNGKTCLFGFRAVGLLPESFASYNMISTSFAITVAKHLNWLPCPNLRSMNRIRARLWMTADATLGLDENGCPRVP